MLEDDPMNTEEYAIMCNCPEVQDATGNDTWYDGETWLPSQRQIQDMIHRLTCEFRLMQDFYYWAARVRSGHLNMIKDRTMEQLWLMFFMWREHEKVWDREQMRWVDERTYGLIVE